MPRVVRLLQVLVVAASLDACEDPRAASSVDSWLRPGPPGAGSRTGKELESSRIHPVPDAMEARAEDLLSERSCVLLTGRQVEEVLGRPGSAAAGTRPYLVRGVCLDRDHGRFSVTVAKDELWVHHGCLGRQPLPMTRQALVVELEAQPREVYVGCSMAE
jgi:hypothetical protein